MATATPTKPLHQQPPPTTPIPTTTLIPQSSPIPFTPITPAAATTTVSPIPITPAASTVSPATVSKSTPAPTPTLRLPEPSSTSSKPEPVPVPIPSYSRWFSWNKVHECEIKSLPEFFDGKSPSKTPDLYKYYRNSIIRRFRRYHIHTISSVNALPSSKITFTEARKVLVGDVGSIRRVFDFLETWGLINYYGSPTSKTQSKLDDKEGKANNNDSGGGGGGAAAATGGGGGDGNAGKKRVCSNCNSVCTIACFSSLVKKDLTLCARCYVSGGVNSSDYTRVEIREDAKMDWTDKETLQLLEAVMHFGDDWKKVAERVVGRNEKDCINRFIKLPFGEQFIGPPDSVEDDALFKGRKDRLDSESSPSKRMRLTPLADASNPIMAQAAFLSALVGVEVAEAAASAAVRTLSEVNSELEPNDEFSKNALEEAQLQLEKEEQDLEKAISTIAEVQAKEIHDKIIRFEEIDLQMEKERQQIKQMQNLLFVDQLTLLFHKTTGPKRRETIEENVVNLKAE